MADYGAMVIGPGWVAGEHVKGYCQDPRTEIRAIVGCVPEDKARAEKYMEMHGFEADYYEDCLSEWNTEWTTLGYDDKVAFREACNASVETGRSQVGECCEGAEGDDLKECEANTLLAIDRNCENTKEYLRQPCADYWQEVFVFGGPEFPGENPTCDDEGDDDDSAG